VLVDKTPPSSIWRVAVDGAFAQQEGVSAVNADTNAGTNTNVTQHTSTTCSINLASQS